MRDTWEVRKGFDQALFQMLLKAWVKQRAPRESGEVLLVIGNGCSCSCMSPEIQVYDPLAEGSGTVAKLMRIFPPGNIGAYAVQFKQGEPQLTKLEKPSEIIGFLNEHPPAHAPKPQERPSCECC